MAQAITDPVEAAAQLKERVDGAKKVVFFGGAGVSTASGIPDFRSEDGLYSQHFKYPPETMLGHQFFCEHTAEFYRFYRERMIALGAKPTGLARCETEPGAQEARRARGRRKTDRRRYAEHRRSAPVCRVKERL